MGARKMSNKGGRGVARKRGPKPKPLDVPKIDSSLVDPTLFQITKRIPSECLANFEEENSRVLYASILLKFVEETIPEGSTILQVLVAERAAYYWTVAHAFERTVAKGVSEEYKFYVYEFNRNLEILRGLAIRNLPAQQVRLLAKKTINVIERIVENPVDKDKIIKEIVQEFTIEVSNIGFKKSSAQVESLIQSPA